VFKFRWLKEKCFRSSWSLFIFLDLNYSSSFCMIVILKLAANRWHFSCISWSENLKNRKSRDDNVDWTDALKRWKSKLTRLTRCLMCLFSLLRTLKRMKQHSLINWIEAKARTWEWLSNSTSEFVFSSRIWLIRWSIVLSMFQKWEEIILFAFSWFK
jgi:hypothetical protein